MNKISSPRLHKAASAIAAIAAIYALSGCARATIGSEVKPNGSWVRTVQLHGPPPDKSGGLMPAGKLEDAFAVPGAPWTVTKSAVKDGEVVTCKRNMQLGETASHDVVCRAKSNGKTVDVAVNECSVKETSPGVYTYREAIHWIGPKPKSFVDIDAAKILKSALPPSVATDASVNRLVEAVIKETVMAFMGPPDPLITTIFSQLMMNPDLAQRKISARMNDGLEKALIEEYGDKLSAEQRRVTVKKLVDAAFKSTSDKTDVDPTKGKDNSSMSALTFSVQLPGKILSSNGLLDKATNEVYWGMYPEAASLGQDIVLTASCQAK